MPQSTSRESHRLRHRAVGLAGLAFFATLLAAGCGSRGPLDLEGTVEEDSGADADVPDVEVVDATPPPKDAAPETGTGLIDCGLCIANKCGGAILSCITKPACQQILSCVTQTCIGGSSGLNPICLLTCAQSAPTGAGDAIAVVSCLTQTCGPTCIDILSGLGGLGGGGGGGGGVTDAGRRDGGDAGRRDGGDASIEGGVGRQTIDDRRRMVNYLFSPWPELTCPAEQP